MVPFASFKKTELTKINGEKIYSFACVQDESPCFVYLHVVHR